MFIHLTFEIPLKLIIDHLTSKITTRGTRKEAPDVLENPNFVGTPPQIHIKSVPKVHRIQKHIPLQ